MSNWRPAPNPLLAWREIQDQVVIISPTDSVLHQLNTTASFIWQQMNGTRTLAEIAALLADRYAVPVTQAEADAAELLAQLSEKHLLDPGTGTEESARV
jgi:coenzyme PQQ biosynthesis protein PqqD